MSRLQGTDFYPIGVGMAQSPERWEEICILFDKLPRGIRDVASSPRTAAFIRGLTKIYNLPLEQGPTIAYIVLQIMLGEKTLAQLPTLLSSDLKIANDKAQAIASEIEKELFGPIMLTYNQFMQTRKNQPKQSMGGATNVLNLKTSSRPVTPPLGTRPQNSGLTSKSGPTLGRLGTSTRSSLPTQPPQLPRPPQPRNMM